MKQTVTTEKAPAAVGPYAQANVWNDLVFTSGMLPLDPVDASMPADVQDQTRQSLTNLKCVLEAAGSSMDHVVKTTVFIQNMSDFAQINEVYEEFFLGDFPSRSCVEVAALPKGALVEVEAVATLQ